MPGNAMAHKASTTMILCQCEAYSFSLLILLFPGLMLEFILYEAIQIPIFNHFTDLVKVRQCSDQSVELKDVSLSANTVRFFFTIGTPEL